MKLRRGNQIEGRDKLEAETALGPVVTIIRDTLQRARRMVKLNVKTALSRGVCGG